MQANLCKTCKFSSICYSLGMQAVLQYIADKAVVKYIGGLDPGLFTHVRRSFDTQLPAWCPSYEKEAWHLREGFGNIEVYCTKGKNARKPL